MKLNELSQHITEGKIQALNLISVEGGSYVLHAQLSDKAQPVHDDTGKTLHVASVEEARKCLSSVPEVPFFLVHPTAYDEMVGLASAENSTTREPIKFRSTL